MYFFCAEPYEMKTNEVQKVSEHLKKSFISVSHLETATIEGGRAPYFFHKIFLRSFVTVNSLSRAHRGSIPRWFPTRFSGQIPGSFPTRGPCHWHRLVWGVNSVSWMGLSWSNSFLGPGQLAAVGSACLRCGQGCGEAAAGPWLHAWLSQSVGAIHLPFSGPKGRCCRYTHTHPVPILRVIWVHTLCKASVLDPLQLFQLRIHLSLANEVIFACKQLQVQLEMTFFPERYSYLFFNSHASFPDEKGFLGHLVRPMSVPCLWDRSSPMTGLSHFRLN